MAIKKSDCRRCNIIPCLDLYDKLDDSELVGNELHVYSLLADKVHGGKENLGVHVCTNGSFIQASCYIVNSIKDSARLKVPCLQTVRDLRSSIYLAFSGHYRQAFQVLRCCIEALIMSIWFDISYDIFERMGDNQAKDIVQKEFRVWQRGEHRDISLRNKLQFLNSHGFFKSHEREEYRRLYSELSSYIHSPIGFYSRETIKEEILKTYNGKGKEIELDLSCLSKNYFDIEMLKKWSLCFQKTFSVFLRIILFQFPEVKKTKGGKLAEKIIRTELNGDQRTSSFYLINRVMEELWTATPKTESKSQSK